jgi:AcrR family transcriptional regulator
MRHRPAGDATTLRDHLVAAADELLDAQSAGNLTTRKIARHAGVSDGVLYNHFADKTDLVLAAMVRRYGRLVERVEKTTPRAGEGTVLGNVQSYGRGLSQVEAEVMLHGAALLSDPPLLQRFWAEIHRSPFGIDRLRAPLRDYLDDEQGRGRVSAEVDVDAAVTVVFGACAMVALTRRLNRTADPAQLDRHLDAALAAAVGGFGASVAKRPTGS